MQRFSKNELIWTAREMSGISARMKKRSTKKSAPEIERALYRLRAEQYKNISEKLMASVEKGDRRIAIR